jgi:lipoprotein NlpI
MNLRFAVAIIIAVSLSACATTQTSNDDSVLNNLLVVTPQVPDSRYQLEVAKLNEILSRQMELEDSSYAELLYRRGSLYDALGLMTLARIDMNHAIEYNPRLAGAYYHLAIQYTAIGEFAYAYELYDAVLELEPEHEYVRLSRGINAYYDGSIEYAIKELESHMQLQPGDPYRTLWLYLAEVEHDPEAARLALAQRRVQHGNEAWGWKLIDLMLGVVSEQKFLTQLAVKDLAEDETLVERMCETYFYLGKQKQLEGDFKAATVYFRMAMNTNVHLFVEHRFAGVELARTEQALGALAQQAD